MTPEKWKRVQEWHDGIGSPAERRDIEEWLHTDPEAGKLLADLELQGVLLREVIELETAGLPESNLWEKIAPTILSEKPAWRNPALLPEAKEAAERPRESESEELPLRGWVLAMLAVASLLLVISLVQPIRDRPLAGGEVDAVAEAVETTPDHNLEIESMEFAVAAYVDKPEDNQPTIIWVSYDDDSN